MELPDFSQFQPLLAVRSRMGADQTVELTQSSVWLKLRDTGIDIRDIEEVVPLEDNTLSYLGHRILVYIRDQYLNPDGSPRGYRFHVAECKTLQDMRAKKRFGRYVGTTRKDGFFLANYLYQGDEGVAEEGVVAELAVCKNCLKALDWESYASGPKGARKKIWVDFTPEGFFGRYQSHVVCMPTHNEYSAPLNVYPENWDEISARVRQRAGWRCERCQLDLAEEENHRFLHVHHKDGNKPNTDPANLEALCICCHSAKPAHERLKFNPDYRLFEERFGPCADK